MSQNASSLAPSALAKGGLESPIVLFPPGVGPEAGRRLAEIHANSVPSSDATAEDEVVVFFKSAIESSEPPEQEILFSAVLCAKLENLLQTKYKADVHVLHQAPTGPRGTADIVFVDKDTLMYRVVGEMKLLHDGKRFPEAQLARYAMLRVQVTKGTETWFPVFEIDSSGFRVGVAFKCELGKREWAHFAVATEDLSGRSLAKVVTTLLAAVQLHRHHDSEPTFANLSGTNLGSPVQIPLKNSWVHGRVFASEWNNTPVAVKWIADADRAKLWMELAHVYSPLLEAQVVEAGTGCALIVTKWHEPSAASTEAVQDLVATIKQMHADGYVHGDIRLPNVAFTGNRAVLLDFDWSGRDGEVRFPSRLNPEVYPATFRPNRAIKQAHDLIMLERFLSAIGVTNTGEVVHSPQPVAIRGNLLPTKAAMAHLESEFELGALNDRLRLFEETKPGGRRKRQPDSESEV
mmetsp:Transcript_16732/g.33460  ORF Transcript_16732/g.33460 Transcript_16732/m.33460 type:complete len:462 (-) Transcript_16732:114-1499(-)|eukprot:CAMPEP_0181300464 /NCGR_PEP_ID=MMETSP1101-20121128/6904_1 /TAXON_ID=46948 /ORGANISM="Rhodomonas abbreviata, Strain Caron Lab Isolate" /LENGTH=461 /DNA_ID=CAMNT_0023405703 /DNA_START=48 /DNA_END=1433 /DNA_ORIENTATION=+